MIEIFENLFRLTDYRTASKQQISSNKWVVQYILGPHPRKTSQEDSGE